MGDRFQGDVISLEAVSPIYSSYLNLLDRPIDFK